MEVKFRHLTPDVDSVRGSASCGYEAEAVAVPPRNSSEEEFWALQSLPRKRTFEADISLTMRDM